MVVLSDSGVARSFLMPGPDEAMDLKPVGGYGNLWLRRCLLVQSDGKIIFSINYQRKISIRKIKVVRPRFCLKLIYIWNKILLLIINKPC